MLSISAERLVVHEGEGSKVNNPAIHAACIPNAIFFTFINRSSKPHTNVNTNNGILKDVMRSPK